MKGLLLVLCWFQLCNLIGQNLNFNSKISIELQKELLIKPKTEVMIQFQDLKLNLEAYQSSWDKNQKGAFIFKALSDNAQYSQRKVQLWLSKKGVSFKSLILVNVLYASLTKEQITELIQFPEVKFLFNNPEIFVNLPQPIENNTSLRSASEWGIDKIKAPAVWAMGITGKGIVIAGQDTGYDWKHPDLLTSYRGYTKELTQHDYHWFDAIEKASPLQADTLNPCGYSVKIPCDDDTHGTHTMGTMVGKDASGSSIGVAPGAQWIGGRNMERGYGNPFSYLACFDWFLAPRDLQGKNPKPALAPHVINNSWSCPTMEGCLNNHVELFEKSISLLKKAGIMVVVSAGNDGGGCQTMTEIPVIISGAFSVGATRSNDSIASFSSRGPAMILGKMQVKPDVSAPGVSVKSSIPGNRYAFLSGTSMAGPHVAGMVALVLSANPKLIGQVEKVEQLIRETSQPLFSAQDCGGVSGRNIPNAVFGYGRIDALAAVKKALSVTPVVETKALDIKIYPLQGHQQLFISMENIQEDFTLTLWDLFGREIIKKAISTYSQVVSLPQLPNGNYVYMISNKEKMTNGILFINQNR